MLGGSSAPRSAAAIARCAVIRFIVQHRIRERSCRFTQPEGAQDQRRAFMPARASRMSVRKSLRHGLSSRGDNALRHQVDERGNEPATTARPFFALSGGPRPSSARASAANCEGDQGPSPTSAWIEERGKRGDRGDRIAGAVECFRLSDIRPRGAIGRVCRHFRNVADDFAGDPGFFGLIRGVERRGRAAQLPAESLTIDDGPESDDQGAEHEHASNAP